MEKQITTNYTSSPLPFMGQKRNFSRQFMSELESLPDDLIIVDLFGGSGLLSHCAKRVKPNSRVIYNDYDNFQLRLKSIDDTNELIDFSRGLMSGLKKGERIPNDVKSEILALIKDKQDKTGYIDYITLSSQFLFSGSYVQSYTDLSKATWYNKVRTSKIEVEGYLNGVEIVTFDYRDLYEKFKRFENVVFIIDPPYLQTQSIAYKNHWNLGQHLDTLTMLLSEKFFYFTSSKSQIVELMDWLDSHDFMISPFKYCKRMSNRQVMGQGRDYEDIMFVKNLGI